jgi:hypothetical protein
MARKSFIKRSAAFHGPSVWLLEGPTPILNISKTEMGSYGKAIGFYKNTYSEVGSERQKPLMIESTSVVAPAFRNYSMRAKSNKNFSRHLKYWTIFGTIFLSEIINIHCWINRIMRQYLLVSYPHKFIKKRY